MNRNTTKYNIYLLFQYFILIGSCIICFDEIPSIFNFFLYARLLIFFIILVKIIIGGQFKFDSFLLLSTFYVLVVAYSSLTNNVNVNRTLLYVISFLALLLSLRHDIKNNLDETLVSLSIVLSFYCFLNFFLLVLHPEGLWTGWSDERQEPVALYFIGGSHNQMGAALLVSYVTCQTSFLRTHRMRLLSLLILLSSLFCVLFVGSKTSLVGFLILLAVRLIKSKKLKKRLLFIFILFYFVFQVFAVFLLYDFSSIGWVRYIVEDLLQKDLSFSGRAKIWLSSLLVIADSPMIGYGFQDIEWFQMYIDAVSPHNLVYWLLLRGGTLALLCFVGLVFLNTMDAFRNTDNISNLHTFGLWVLLFMSIMEAYNSNLYFYLLAFMFYITYFHRRKHVKKTKHLKQK